MKVLNIANDMLLGMDVPFYEILPAPCCSNLTMKEASTWWPRKKQGNMIPEETLGLALKWFQTEFKPRGFNCKISKKTNQISLL